MERRGTDHSQAVREQWDAAAARRHSALKKVQLYVCRAENTVNGQRLSLPEKFIVAQNRKKSKKSKDKGELRGGLPYDIDVELVAGMKVMVTFNIHTETDSANGTRG